MIGNARFHRRSDAQAAMNPAEIVAHEMKRNRVLWLSTFLEKAVGSRVMRRIQPVNGTVLSY